MMIVLDGGIFDLVLWPCGGGGGETGGRKGSLKKRRRIGSRIILLQRGLTKQGVIVYGNLTTF